MINYQIFTDGSCRTNGNGGIGVVWIKNGKKVFEYSKSFKNTTNNQMELIAILYALMSIKSPIDSLEMITDSEYCIGVITNPNWKLKKNIKLISIVKKAVSIKQQLVKEPIKWTHVKGHQKVCDINAAYNNLCDTLATEASNMIL